MGNKIVELKFKVGADDNLLRKKIRQKLKLSNFSYKIIKKSMDARVKSDIFWNYRVVVTSSKIKGEEYKERKTLKIPKIGKKRSVTIVGFGPAGYFCGYVLAKSGFEVTVLEQGKKVEDRCKDIARFEITRELDEKSNYSFGEGGAGTFSDGKLTSRTKSINLERDFIYKTYILAGAPDEILYMTHPHLGTDNLKVIVKNLREMFIKEGGNILFSQKVVDIKLKNTHIDKVITDRGFFSSDYYIFATGHSSSDTYNMLIDRNIPFRIKPFAIGMRVEHYRETINIAQWGVPNLEGFKAAEYRLSHKNMDSSSTYSFCMCPGGKIVPVTPFKNKNIVNGMSNFGRNSSFSNAAIVTNIDIRKSGEKVNDPKFALNWLSDLEDKFFDYTKGFDVPAIRVSDFLQDRESSKFDETSFPFGLRSFLPSNLFPEFIVKNLKEGLLAFNSKLDGFDSGTLIGLESKTSSPIQVLRDKNLFVEGVENMLYCGEGSGYSGGIISSAADGIKAAFSLINKNL
ncbi:MAG: FAD-dependent oxidoreductase [Candidatus Cloacimonadota bacterium]|nr:MAG: FAD-dependent oxidoreductase [Candidatus Cloacimonadota bacterium]PIE81122.1 MAG: FAD-dependent oxidoreductase [Candidatus Delongbacteria bacterium]